MAEFYEVIQNHSKIDTSFLIIADKEFPTIDTGILFMMAEWSAPSLVQFQLLTETLSKIDLNGLKIHVFDTDVLTPDDITRHGIPIPQGWGETYWFKDGKPEYFLESRTRDISKIISFTKELLS